MARPEAALTTARPPITIVVERPPSMRIAAPVPLPPVTRPFTWRLILPPRSGSGSRLPSVRWTPDWTKIAFASRPDAMIDPDDATEMSPPLPVAFRRL